ncbi:phosphate signaling complex protein PhoU [Acidimicrobiaceae bacterium]|jgi:phosphate transport system protein|nr:phosphate signaling complex protein PhoU [Acidimicrobiaceae bacterium]MDC3010395.1 phosphate signaling complex protein PhoU [bacterium]MEC7840848.1 phosphate signaling complex protein PhoU [Actinomycetota bacterium]MEC8329419.1 phosphate signaling complex protein PhoU [Actinomycetota bacterium]MED5382463.1 phosphate signaling complex protein PhoU [Actinomycetota bacterium]|tara:strand:+ start:243 stop:884 length:642 start_codon:yes stop_codon:yes gene_type:complete
MSLQEKIENLETDLHLMGRLVLDSLVDGVRALEDKDVNRAIATIEKDDEIDDAYLKIDQDWVELMATEQLVATDLRLSTSILQASLHLERLGDLAVYLGNTTQEIFDSPVPETIHATVVEMGDLVIDMASSAMESLKNRDKDLAIATAEKDNQVNRLYNAILEEAPKIAGNEDLFNGLFRLVTCIRTLERGGDHAVDICELTHFLVTGKFKEF